VKINLWP
jgi:hypothetical protein